MPKGEQKGSQKLGLTVLNKNSKELGKKVCMKGCKQIGKKGRKKQQETRQ